MTPRAPASEPQAAVWKYELHPGVTVLQMPQGSRALTVAAQDGGVFLWADVLALRHSPTGMAPVPTEPRAFLTLGTGHRAHPASVGRYVGTAFLDGLVWHTFETGLPEASNV
jgi:hypothetical protein